MAIIVAIVILLAFLALCAAICGGLVYAGWNWGVLAAFPASGLGHLSFWQALCLGLIIGVIGDAFRRHSRSKR